jgi:hypothetical protein
LKLSSPFDEENQTGFFNMETAVNWLDLIILNGDYAKKQMESQSRPLLRVLPNNLLVRKRSKTVLQGRKQLDF